MWQPEKKDTSIVKLVLWLTLATTPMAATLMLSVPTLGQSTPETSSFPLPQTVDNGTTVRINGSSSLVGINQSLKDNFEKQFAGTKVEIAANGTDTALRDLLDNKIDIAAIGRGLKPAEKALGLEQVRLRREKIAIVVSADNPFKQSLTSRQFARIFRGQITNWSQLGGPDGKIRFIDRPETSDTRNTFRDYPAFKAGKFATGSNATQVTDDNTAEIVKQLGKNGISYVLANEVSKLQGVRVLQLHQTLPDDTKYPFSQPLVYVYKKNPSIATKAFLGFTLAKPGQDAIEKGITAEAEAIAASVAQPSAAPPSSAETTPNPTASPSATTSVFGEQPFVAPAPEKLPIVNKGTPFWLLLPLFVITAVGGGLLWLFLGRRPSVSEKTDNLPESNPYPPNRDDLETSPNIDLEDEPLPDFPERESDRTPFQIYNQTSSEFTQNGTLQEATNGTANYSQNTNPGVVNLSENNLGAAALGGGAALATGIGAATWSAFNEKRTETDPKDHTTNVDTNTEINPSESGEVAWDIEAPAAVVNNSYPHLGNLSEDTSNVATPLPELPDVPKATSSFDYWDTEVTEDVMPEELQAELEWLETITSTEDTVLPESDEVVADELAVGETTSLLEFPEDALNVVADAAEPTEDLLEEESQREPDFAGAAALAGAAGIGAWASTVDNVPNAAETEEQSSIVLTSRTSTSVHISWDISATDQQVLREQGGSQLVLRLYDVTGIDLSYQVPHLVQQYECEQTAQDGFVDIPASDRAYIAEIGYIAEGDRWFFFARSAIVHIFSPVEPDPIVDSPNGVVDPEEQSSIVLTPRTFTSADISWDISPTQKQALRQQGVSQLLVRLYDVTHIDLSYQTPHLVQQYECEEILSDRFVAIPASDRDYMAEIGYIAEGDAEGGKLQWLFIARSPNIHVFSPVEPNPIVEELPVVNETANGLVEELPLVNETANGLVEELPVVNETANGLVAKPESSIVLTSRTPKWAYVSWYISETHKQELHQSGASQLAVRLYDVTGIDLSYQNPQLVQQYECEEVVSDRFVAIPVSDRDYMAEIGYLAEGDAYGGKLRWLFIARSTNIRVFNRPHGDFWFVADAELIIHGATEPNTTVAIGGNNIKIKPDGTFHLRLPFSDGLMDYLITVATDGESPRTIHKKFFQETSES
jgi:phosphate transport system substrate-binding protein